MKYENGKHAASLMLLVCMFISFLNVFLSLAVYLATKYIEIKTLI